MRGAVFNHLPLMITCRQLEEFIIDYLEGDLPKRQRTVFELHLMLCPECRNYLAAYRETMELAKRVATSEPPSLADKMPEDLIRAILAARQV
jgi:predicted anti-sigma-YlaC factor YlaD